MNGIHISTDEVIYWQWDAFPAVKLNATIVFTWGVMVLLVLESWLIIRRLGREHTRSRVVDIVLLALAGLLVLVGAALVGAALFGRLFDHWQVLGVLMVSCGVVLGLLVALAWSLTRRGPTEAMISPGQNLLEVVVKGMRDQIRDVSGQDPARYLAFVGTLFLFVGMANLLSIVPGYRPPTGSLSTTAALATCVFVAVPIYGIASQGLGGYLRHYVRPSVVMLPFNIIGEFSRTLALAVRLYGNMMSGAVIAAILLGFVPLFVPILMQMLGLLTGMIQAYIFAVLAMVYVASATKIYREAEQRRDQQPDSNATQQLTKGEGHG